GWAAARPAYPALLSFDSDRDRLIDARGQRRPRWQDRLVASSGHHGCAASAGPGSGADRRPFAAADDGADDGAATGGAADFLCAGGGGRIAVSKDRFGIDRHA